MPYPSLDVLLLCWNHTEFLEDTIQSLSLQRDRDFNIVFLDNNSQDGSFEMAGVLFKKYGLSATLIKNDQAKGIAQNLNTLLSHSSADLVSPISTDDYYSHDYVEKMRAAAKERPEASIFFGQRYDLHHDTGELCGPLTEFKEGDLRTHLNQVVWPINMVGVCYWRKRIVEIGGWDEGQLAEDTDMFYRLLQIGEAVYIRSPLVTYRISKGSISRQRDFVHAAWRSFLKKHGEQFPLRGRLIMSEVLRTGAALAIDKGDTLRAFKYILQSARAYPSNRLIPRTFSYLIRASLGQVLRDRT